MQQRSNAMPAHSSTKSRPAVACTCACLDQSTSTLPSGHGSTSSPFPHNRPGAGSAHSWLSAVVRSNRPAGTLLRRISDTSLHANPTTLAAPSLTSTALISAQTRTQHARSTHVETDARTTLGQRWNETVIDFGADTGAHSHTCPCYASAGAGHAPPLAVPTLMIAHDAALLTAR